ncbi:S49 family peptidase [Marinomonas agarivorans]|nr:S49 family peptidase [Marinomonas agarivorans]
MAWTEQEDKGSNSIDGSASIEQEFTTSKEKRSDVNNMSEKSHLWSLLESTLKENVQEKRRARRWKIFFRVSYLVVFIVVIGLVFGQAETKDLQVNRDFVAVLPLEGQIGAGQPIDANSVLELLDEAYSHRKIQALILKMNSPGGSPVHAGIIYDAIQLKQAQYPEVPVHVVVEDLAASGGYYIAAAADQILADKASLVGSIGVISAGFDLTELMEKVGVKRRVFTAGENKAFLDPFLPLNSSSAKKWQAVLDETHEQFIHAVKVGRGDKLADHPDLFTGAVFSGVKAVELGLIDGLSSFHQLVKQSYAGMEVVYFVEDEEPWRKITETFGITVANAILKMEFF